MGTYTASNETLQINLWLLFLIAITDIITYDVFHPLHFHQNHSLYADVMRGLTKRLTDSVSEPLGTGTVLLLEVVLI